MNKILIFPEPFRIKNPTCDEQNSYLIPLWMDESAMNGIGSFVEVNTLQEADYGNVPEYARQHTFGFFGALPKQEKRYELFQTVYPNTTWYLNVSELRLIDIKDIVLEIVNSIV